MNKEDKARRLLRKVLHKTKAADLDASAASYDPDYYKIGRVRVLHPLGLIVFILEVGTAVISLPFISASLQDIFRDISDTYKWI